MGTAVARWAGSVPAVGVASTGAHGAGLGGHLAAAGVPVIGVDRLRPRAVHQDDRVTEPPTGVPSPGDGHPPQAAGSAR